MKKIKKQSLAKIAAERTKNTFTRKMGILAIFVMFCLASLMLALFLPETLILTVPFLIVPSVFSFMAINTIFDMPIQSDEFGFFMMFKLYYTRFFFGSFKLWKAFFKALLWALLITFITSTIFLLINPSILDSMSNIIETASNETMTDELLKFMESNETYNLFTTLVTVGSFGVGFLVFTHSVLVEGFKYYFNFLAKAPILAQDLNTIAKPVFKKNRFSFYKDYYSCVWFIPILMIAGFAGGVALGMFMLELDSTQICVVGLAGSLLMSMFAIPYYFDATLVIYKKYQKDYMDSFISLSLETLKMMKQNEEITKEKEKEIKDFLDKQKQENKKDEKK